MKTQIKKMMGAIKMLSIKKIDNVAIIKIEGTLINGNFDNNNYCSIEKLKIILEECSHDIFIDNIVLEINSTGGSVFGITDIVKVISNAKKKHIALCGYYCASAAYWIASACEQIIATTDISYFGSIGVVSSSNIFDFEYWTNNNESPKKAPDIRTDEGKAIIKENLDEIYSLFVSSVASSRNIELNIVKNSFADGSVFLPKKAMALGMIDHIDYSFDYKNYFI